MKTFLLLMALCGVAACSGPTRVDKADPLRIQVTLVDETPKQLAQREQIKSAMHTPRIDIDLKHVSLEEALAQIQQATGVRMHVIWEDLELVGIERDSLVQYKGKELTPAVILDDILASVSAGAFEDDKADWMAREGRVFITTRRAMNAITTTRMYNVGTLVREPYRPVGTLFSDDAFEDTLAFHAWVRGERRYPMTDAMLLQVYKQHIERMQKELDKLDAEGVVPDKADEPQGQGGSLFGENPDRGRSDDYILPSIQIISELIESSVGGPNVWLDDDYTLSIKGEQLIVKTNPKDHDQIEIILNKLLSAEIQSQAAILTDAHATEQVALANEKFKAGDRAGARKHIQSALAIMPNHVPAHAMKQLLDAMEGRPTKGDR